MKTVAKALIFNKAGHVLLLRRSSTHPNYPHHFDFPGGEVERGEACHKANQREILEETNLVVPGEAVQFLYKKQISPELTHIVHRVQLQEERPNIILSWEHDSFVWLDLDQFLNCPLPENPDNYYQTVLEYLRKA